MAHYTITKGRAVGSLPSFPLLGSLRAIMDRNWKNCFDYYTQGNYVIPNQNPLVQFLIQLSIDPNWTAEELEIQLTLNIKRVASQVGFTSIYNRGKDHTGSVFPEENHRTLIVVPFEEDYNWKNDGETEYETRPVLRTIMSTGVKHYWNPVELIDGIKRTAADEVYTILELQAYRFANDYWHYLRGRIKEGRNIGQSPHHFVLYSILTAYMQYNATVMLNLVSEDCEPEIQNTDFALEPYAHRINSYTQWLNHILMINGVKHMCEYSALIKSPYSDFFPQSGVVPLRAKSIMFSQLAWAYTMSNLYWVEGFLGFMDFLGREDGIEMAALRTFFKVNPSIDMGQIKNELWRKKYKDIYDDVKKY